MLQKQFVREKNYLFFQETMSTVYQCFFQLSSILHILFDEDTGLYHSKINLSFPGFGIGITIVLFQVFGIYSKID